MKKTIILIGGGTSSGKSMIADILYKQYIKNGLSVTLMAMDNYYISIDKLNTKKGEDVNWDSPNVIDWKKFIKDVKDLKENKNVKKSIYNFSTYSHKGEVEYKSNDFIIIEGLFALFNKDVREMSSSMIFIEADDDIRLMRRIIRDMNGRYKDVFDTEKFLDKWKSEIKTMHKKYVQPTSSFADFIIRNNTDFIGEEKKRMINLLQSIVVK
ncbi:MAG: hypothetical protein HRS50_01485 [Mycoplasmataceae bacterium]|nr:hypothetical protein [Mycoplasmataceae bacterium]